eukprot:COSAG02_NODE_4289_length_5540_cov_40.610101_4_plen_84_part_00
MRFCLLSGSEVIFADRARLVSAEFFSAAAVFEIWLAQFLRNFLSPRSENSYTSPEVLASRSSLKAFAGTISQDTSTDDSLPKT